MYVCVLANGDCGHVPTDCMNQTELFFSITTSPITWAPGATQQFEPSFGCLSPEGFCDREMQSQQPNRRQNHAEGYINVGAIQRLRKNNYLYLRRRLGSVGIVVFADLPGRPASQLVVPSLATSSANPQRSTQFMFVYWYSSAEL